MMMSRHPVQSRKFIYKKVEVEESVQGLVHLKASAGELPPVVLSFVDVLKEFGFLHFVGLLVSKTASTASLLHLHTFTAVDVQINVWRNFKAKRQRHHGEVEGVDAVYLFERVGVVSPHVGLVGLLG